MSGRRAKTIRRTASHRPATRRRKNRHDEYVAGDLFSGFGGLTQGIERAGFDTIVAANHNEYKVQVHEANHPHVEHWIADLVDPESADYHDVRQLPAVDLLAAGVSCVNHSPANSKRAYEQQVSLFDMHDPDYEESVTRSERDRATANCVLHYAAVHHPLLILVECTTQLQSWGRLVPGSRKVGDGSTYRWWLKQFELLDYQHQILFLDSRFFFGIGDDPTAGGDQDRNRGFWCFWKKHLPTPDLAHRPISWCHRCSTEVEALWTWKTGPTPTGKVAYGEQYNYRCPSCRTEVIPPSGYALRSMDLTDLGTRIGDMPLKKLKDKATGEIYHSQMARATMARADRCLRKFPDFPAVLMPAKAVHGSERHPWQPMATQTSQQETAILSTGAIMQMANTFESPGSDCRTRDLSEPLWTQPASLSTGMLTPPVALAVDNFQGAPRGADEPFPTQGGSETMAVLSSGVLPFRQHTAPTSHAEPMSTITAQQIPGVLTAAGTIKQNGSIDEAKYRAHPVSDPLGTVVGSAVTQGMLFSGWYKQNGSEGTETAPHPLSDPFGTLTSRDTTAVLAAEWRAALSDLALEDCYFRMMKPHEIGRACGFDVDYNGRKGTFKVWGSDRNQVDGFGNAVYPAIPIWIGTRLRAVLHGEAVA